MILSSDNVIFDCSLERILIALALIFICILANKLIFTKIKETNLQKLHFQESKQVKDVLRVFEQNGFIKLNSYRPNSERDFKQYRDELYSVKSFKREYPEAKGFVCFLENNKTDPYISVCDPELIEEIMVSNEKNYERDVTISYVARILGNSLLFNLPEDWKLKRKMYGQLFHFAHQQVLCDIVEQIAEKHINKFKFEHSSQLINVFEWILGEWSLNLFFGSIPSQKPELINQLQKYYNEARSTILLLQPQKIGECLNPLKRILQQFFKFTIDSIKQDSNFKQHPQNNITWHLLSSDQVKLDEKFINDVCEDITIFFFAGRDTMAHTLQMLFYYICKNKFYYQQIEKEIKDMNRKYTTQGLLNSKYLDAVLKETLRHYGPTTTILPKVAMEEHSLQNGQIPIKESTIISLAIQELHYDPKYYPDPDRFYPERWFNQKLKSQEKKVFMPFSFGSHKCIGDKLAFPIIKMIVVMFLSNFLIDVDPEYQLELVALIQYTPYIPIPFNLIPKQNDTSKL